jgi:DNA invertase Pin-like site-specific DNA recombinase
MLAVFAEFERDILRDRVKAGIAQARNEGKAAWPSQDRCQAGEGNAAAAQEWPQQKGNRQTPGRQSDIRYPFTQV